MADRLSELAEIVLDRVYTYGFQQRALEDEQRKAEDDLLAAERKLAQMTADRDHWREARRMAIEAGELMKAEIETLRANRDYWRGIAESYAIPPKQSGDNAELERLRVFVDGVRMAFAHYEWPGFYNLIKAALAKLDATNPTPITEPMGGRQ
jgi:hypothetical protein